MQKVRLGDLLEIEMREKGICIRTALELGERNMQPSALEKLTDGYAFIRLLYDRIFIPPAVLEEIADREFDKSLDYMKYYGVSYLI